MLEPALSFLRHLTAQNRSARTKKTYVAIAGALLASIGRRNDGTVAPSRGEVESFLGRSLREGGGRSAATRNQELAALRAFATFAKRELGWKEDPTEGISFLKEQPRDPPVLSVFEIRRLFSLASASSRGWQRQRDLAVLALLSQLGLRVHELVALNIEQIDLATATLLDVDGKGGSRHDLPLNAQTLALLQAWLAVRGLRVGSEEPALFIAPNGRRLSIRSVERFVARLRQLSGTKKRVTPHTLRHSAATVSLTLGTDVSTVAELLRHADLNTTRRYLHLVDERKREAVRKLAVVIPPEFLVLAPSVALAPAGGASSPDAPSPPAPAPSVPPGSCPNTVKEAAVPTLDVDDQGDLDAPVDAGVATSTRRMYEKEDAA
ncbi:MAG: tyrosine-type recombinase/integrase [Polyangiaceae bacterium]